MNMSDVMLQDYVLGALVLGCLVVVWKLYGYSHAGVFGFWLCFTVLDHLD